MIDRFAEVRPKLQWLAANGPTIPLGTVRLLPPLPRPGKILCSTNGYGVHRTAEHRPPQLLTLKSPESVIGPGGTVELPAVGHEWQFVPEAELGLVIRGPARRVQAADWRSVVFGYTCVLYIAPALLAVLWYALGLVLSFPFLCARAAAEPRKA